MSNAETFLCTIGLQFKGRYLGLTESQLLYLPIKVMSVPKLQLGPVPTVAFMDKIDQDIIVLVTKRGNVVELRSYSKHSANGIKDCSSASGGSCRNALCTFANHKGEALEPRDAFSLGKHNLIGKELVESNYEFFYKIIDQLGVIMDGKKFPKYEPQMSMSDWKNQVLSTPAPLRKTPPPALPTVKASDATEKLARNSIAAQNKLKSVISDASQSREKVQFATEILEILNGVAEEKERDRKRSESEVMKSLTTFMKASGIKLDLQVNPQLLLDLLQSANSEHLEKSSSSSQGSNNAKVASAESPKGKSGKSGTKDRNKCYLLIPEGESAQQFIKTGIRDKTDKADKVTTSAEVGETAEASQPWE